MNTRRISSVVHIGSLSLGGENPIAVQSMTTTATSDVAASVAQVKRLAAAGAALVRLTTQGQREAKSMALIAQKLRADGCMVPLVADVHFNASVADTAARYCDKVRINPGNYIDPARRFVKHEYTDAEYAAELQKIDARFTPFLSLCKAHGTAIRIGVNHGSLSDRIRNRYGDTPAGLAESCMEFLRLCQREAFTDVVLSVKASNTVVMVDAVHCLVRAMDGEGMHYPLHLGVTEAGAGSDGRVKSAVGIGALLLEGLGDTIRVSLSEAPEREIPVAQKMIALVAPCQQYLSTLAVDTAQTVLSFAEDDEEELLIKGSMIGGYLLLNNMTRDIALYNHGAFLPALTDAILQAARVRFTKTEYISCPGCGRTLYDLPTTVAQVRAALAAAALTLPAINTLKIAIMGCIVNGPGEMADADYGYVGAGRDTVALYKGKECVARHIPAADAVEHLLRLIKETI